MSRNRYGAARAALAEVQDLLEELQRAFQHAYYTSLAACDGDDVAHDVEMFHQRFGHLAARKVD